MTAREARQLGLDVYGLRMGIAGEWDHVLEALRLDFAWFESAAASARPVVRVEVERRAPDYDRFGSVHAAFVTPRNVVYQRDGLTLVDYFGRALGVLDRATDRIVIQGEEEHLVHEAAYLFLLSRIGQHLDSRGFVRLHALGLAAGDRGIAVMLPSGGGKTTLALRALAQPGVKLLSEDTPLLDAQGRLHPFPLRIGVNAADAAVLPAGGRRRIERMEFHPKVALDLEAVWDELETEPRPLTDLVVGRRNLGREAALERHPRSAAAGALVREAVVGVGVYQGMEFVLQRGMRDVLRKSGTAARRGAVCATALRRARVWRLTVGRDHDANWEALSRLLH